MKVVGFDGREYPWPPLSHNVYPNDKRIRSQYHLRCRNLLKEMYPIDTVLEEVSLPGSSKLSADFYLPWRNLVIEVHGQQHYEYNPFFHGNKIGFINARERDLKKIDWCIKNNIGVVELHYKDTDERWREQIERG